MAGWKSESASPSYVPDPGSVGTDQFTYSAFDGGNESVPATVMIEVAPPPVPAQAAATVIVQAMIGPEPEIDPIIAPVEIPQASTSPGTRPRLLRRIGSSFSHDAQPIDRHRLARQQAVDRIHEGELLEIDAKLRRARRRR